MPLFSMEAVPSPFCGASCKKQQREQLALQSLLFLLKIKDSSVALDVMLLSVTCGRCECVLQEFQARDQNLAQN